MDALNGMGLELHETNWVQGCQELSTACNLDSTVYDVSYLLLAEKTKSIFITADQKLHEKAKGHFRVIHIKEYL
jgi:predicted nucleic acid-binding protein